MTKLHHHKKPIEHDIHLKYRCAKCGQDHWLSYLEASTEQFKIVCYCGKVFVVKRLSGFKLKYFKKPPVIVPVVESVSPVVESICPVVIAPPIIEKPKIPVDLLDKSVSLLIGYGFTATEAKELLHTSYEQNPIDDYASLLKQTLSLLRK